MASSRCLVELFLLLALAAIASSQLEPNFYSETCPSALPTIKRVVEDAVKQEQRMGASLLRLHFHDCFVNGCDGSVLLDNATGIDSEKNAIPNLNSARGFDVVDRIKAAVDEACGGPVVSCADILTVAARDSVVALGGPFWEVLLGRRDSTNASRIDADNDIPAPTLNLTGLLANFNQHGLDETDLVALSGGHTLGFARCVNFRNSIYNEPDIDGNFAAALRQICPSSGGDDNLAPLDSTPAKFDVSYFQNLVGEKGLLHSDQALFNGGATDALVSSYSTNLEAFSAAFVKSIIKMGNLQPLTGTQGQIRKNCRVVN